MSIERVVSRLFDHRRILIAVLLVVTAGFAASAASVEEDPSMDQFEPDGDAAEKLDYVTENFEGGTDATSAQVIIRDENVLDRETLVETLAFQESLRENETINETLVADTPTVSVANAVATAAIGQERAAALEARGAELNETERALKAALDRAREDGDRSVREEFDEADANAPITLGPDHYEPFAEAATKLRTAENESAVRAAYRRGTRGALSSEYAALEAERRALEDGIEPSLAAQRAQLEEMSDAEVRAIVASLLGGDADVAASDAESNESVSGTVADRRDELLALLPASYDRGSTDADRTLLVVRQDTQGQLVAPDTAPPEIIDAQRAIRSHAEDPDTVADAVVGHGITAHEIDASTADSLAVVGPLALGFVLVVLSIAYRDAVDVALGLFGIVVVLVWTFGFMGAAGIDFGLIFVAVPVLLIGLSIDYAIHVVMRGREARDGDRGVEAATVAGLSGVGFALVLVTVTTAVGFLSNLVSPIAPIREFGLVNAVGIGAALIVFGLLIPALKVEIDTALEARGIDRTRRAIGTGDRLAPLLRVGERLARTAPVAVLIVALVLGAGGAYAGTQVDTSFSTDEFLPAEPPEWTDQLPGSLEPGSYTAKATIAELDDGFVRHELRTHVLVEGDPTDPGTLARIADGEAAAANASTTANVSPGTPAVTGPVSTMRQVAAENDTFAAAFHGADTTGDGIPDTNVAGVYDELFAADADAAASVLHRTDDGAYEAARITVYADGDASRGEVTDEMRAVAGAIERGDDPGVGPAGGATAATAPEPASEITATATGSQTVNFHLIEAQLFDTVVQSLLLTFVAVSLILMGLSRLTAGSASLGLVTVVPVLLALSWILGTMFVLGLQFNFVTGLITSLTIGLGVAYSIHICQRYYQRLRRGEAPPDALRTTVTGTGGALLGSAATTAGGFGVLTASFLPSLQQFGLITGLSIVYAFLASVLVLPTLLRYWTRYLRPAAGRDGESAPRAPDEAAAGRRSGTGGDE